jgi:hypothetical protein
MHGEAELGSTEDFEPPIPERLHRIPFEEWAFIHPWTSEAGFVYFDNHQRAHGAMPVSDVGLALHRESTLRLTECGRHSGFDFSFLRRLARGADLSSAKVTLLVDRPVIMTRSVVGLATADPRL